MDPAIFRELYERTAPGLLAYLTYSCRNSDLAKDLLQETFLRVLRAAPADLDEFKMKSYLYKAAKSALLDHWRKHRHEHSWERVPTTDDATAPQETDLSHDMLRLLGELSERARTLLWLAYVEGFAHREIAELLGVKEKGVRVMLSRARTQLAAKLAGEGMEAKESR